VDALNAVHHALMSGKDRFYIKCATGSGKTIIVVNLFEKYLAVKPSLNFLFVVPKNVLIEQTVEKFSHPNVSIYCAGLNQKQFNSITVGSVQSLVNVMGLPHVDLAIMDECHRVRGAHIKLHQSLLKINPAMKTMGMTATDYDINKDFFTEKVFDIDRTTLTAQGYLAPIVLKSGKDKIDTSDVSMSGGDFVLKELEDRIDIEKIRSQVKDMLSKTQDRKFILIMCISINHAIQIQGMINCFILHSKQSKEDQRNNFEGWKTRGGYIAGVLIPSEGLDYPPADCLVLMRPTRSATLYDQAVGRISRTALEKTNGLFLDYGDVVLELGDPYNITPFKKKKKKTHKICIHCDAIVLESCKYCPECNELFYNECQVCHELKPYGDICCKKKPYDILGNLTGNSFDGEKWIEVTNVTKVVHVTPKCKCWKVSYWSGLKHICDEYLFSNSDKNYKNIKAIKVKRLKYKEIVGRLFHESL